MNRGRGRGRGGRSRKPWFGRNDRHCDQRRFPGVKEPSQQRPSLQLSARALEALSRAAHAGRSNNAPEDQGMDTTPAPDGGATAQ